MEMKTKTPKRMYSFASMKTFSIWPLRYTCSLVDRGLQTSLPGKSQCGCIARMGRGSAAQGSGCKKVLIAIEFMSHLLLLGKFEYGGGPIFKVVLEC